MLWLSASGLGSPARNIRPLVSMGQALLPCRWPSRLTHPEMGNRTARACLTVALWCYIHTRLNSSVVKKTTIQLLLKNTARYEVKKYSLTVLKSRVKM